MGILTKKENCSLCGSETGSRANKKYKLKDGCVCNKCIVSLGYEKNKLPWGAFNDETIEVFNSKSDERKERNAKYKADRKINLAKLEGFECTNRVRIPGRFINIDKYKQIWYMGSVDPNETYHLNVYKFSDVVGLEYSENNKTIRKVKDDRIKRAVVGGVIGGGAGAVVGAITGKETVTEYEKRQSSSLKILFADGTNEDIYYARGDIEFGTSPAAAESIFEEMMKVAE